jgi:hypothetical protein
MFEKHGYDLIHDLVALTAKDVNALDYDEFNAVGVLIAMQLVPRGYQFMIKVFISLFNNYCGQFASVLDCTSILKDNYDNWHLLGYKPNVPFLTHIHNVHGHVCTGPTPAETFERGIKRHKDNYPEFKDKKNWDSSCCEVETTAATHNTIEILDRAYTPNPLDPNDVALFNSKNKWMYSVLSSKLKTYTGMEIIQNHEGDCNAQAVWQELLEHQLTSQVGVYKKEELFQHLYLHVRSQCMERIDIFICHQLP